METLIAERNCEKSIEGTVFHEPDCYNHNTRTTSSGFMDFSKLGHRKGRLVYSEGAHAGALTVPKIV